jgi:hypothetical protein
MSFDEFRAFRERAFQDEARKLSASYQEIVQHRYDTDPEFRALCLEDPGAALEEYVGEFEELIIPDDDDPFMGVTPPPSESVSDEEEEEPILSDTDSESSSSCEKAGRKRSFRSVFVDDEAGESDS